MGGALYRKQSDAHTALHFRPEILAFVPRVWKRVRAALCKVAAGYRGLHGKDHVGVRTEMASELTRQEAVDQTVQLFQVRMGLWYSMGEMSPTQQNEMDRSHLVTEGSRSGWTPDIVTWMLVSS